MALALEQAEEAARAGEVPVGAVAVVGGKAVVSARNRVEERGSATAHAELELLHKLELLRGDWRMEDVTVYVTKEPCPMCAGAIAMSGIDEVLFGAYDPRCGCAGSLYNLPEDAAFGHVIPCSGGLLEAECQGMLDAFFDSRRG